MMKIVRNAALTFSLGIAALAPLSTQAQAQDMLDVIGGAVVGGVIGDAVGGRQGAKTGAALGALGGLVIGADRDYYWY